MNYQPCIDACIHCAEMCDQCVETPLARECAVICSTAAEIMMMDGEFADTVCRLCAEICTACAEECRRHGDMGMEQCRICAEACEACAEECIHISVLA